MGCTSSILSQDEVSKQINVQIIKDREIAKNRFKLLLLGAGGSGKSTIVKQMKIIHGSGYSTRERMEFQPRVHLNAIESMFGILQAMERLSIPLSHPSHLELIYSFKEKTKTFVQSGLTLEAAQLMTILWNDASVQACFYRSIQYQVNDSASYFLNDLCRISKPGYVPTEQDILKCRIRTTGINETSFYYKRMLFVMVDVGGQRSQRKKWLHCFDDVYGTYSLN